MNKRREIAEFFGVDVQAEDLAREACVYQSCTHRDRSVIHVWLSKREYVVCRECLHAGRAICDASRKEYLAAYWRSKASIQSTQLKDCQVSIGMRVQRFCPSMLGLGGMTLTGTLVKNRNGIAVVRMDQKCNGKRFTCWDYGWRERKDGAQ